MSTASAAAELAGLFDSGYGLALLATFEEERGRRVAQETAAKLGLKLISWSSSTGAEPELPGRVATKDAGGFPARAPRPGPARWC